MNSKIAVFFDRDGTLNVEAGYIHDLSNLVLAEGAAAAVKRLNKAGILSILVTNQTGPARGYYPESHVHDLNNRLVTLLKAEDAFLDAVYYCPHYKDGTIEEYSFDCNCRKPRPGMILQAVKDHPEIDLKNSYVIGDKATDVELAKNAGCKGILLTTGFGTRVLEGTYQQLTVQPDFIASNIEQAVEWLLNDSSVAGVQ